MADSTDRLLIPYPEGGDSPPDVAADMRAAVSRVDQVTLTADQGPLASRGPAGNPRRVYWATDAPAGSQLSYDDGVAWQPLPGPGLIPIGGTLDWEWPINPPGPAEWVERLGQTITRAAYPELFETCGIPGGTYTLTDRRGRSPMQAGKAPTLTNRTVGSVLGEERHVISTAELPNYELPISDPGHVHAYDRPAGRTADFGADPDHARYTGAGSNTQRATTEIRVFSGGSGQAANVVHPVFVTRYFLRVR